MQKLPPDLPDDDQLIAEGEATGRGIRAIESDETIALEGDR